MLIDGITLTPGATLDNLNAETGTAFPIAPDAGQMFYLEAAIEGYAESLYSFKAGDWHDMLASGDAGGSGHTYTSSTQPGNLVVQVGTARWYPPDTITINRIEAYVSEAPAGSDIVVSVRKNGVVVETISISNGSNTAIPVATAIALIASDHLTVDIDQIGSTGSGTNLTVRFRS